MHADFRKLLGVLVDRKVDFVVVGGVGALLQGAPITTVDLDVVHARESANVVRLLSVLAEIDAIYRIRPELHRSPSAKDLEGEGHHLLITEHGPLDILGKLASGQSYPDLVASSDRMVVDGQEIYVQDLPSLIRVKELLGSPKDLAVLPLLRSTLEEKLRGGESESS